MSSADNEGQGPEAPDDDTTTAVDPPADATPAEEEAPLTPEAAPQEDATAAEQDRLADAAAEEQAQAPAQEVAEAAAEAEAAPAAPAATEATPEPEPEEPTPEPDPVRQPLLDLLQERLGDDLVGSEVAAGDMWVRVERSAWRTAAEVCKQALGMDYFCFLSGMDWLPNPDLSAEKVWDDDAQPTPQEPGPREYETGLAGGQTRFQVFARLYSTTTHVGITLKADLDEADPRVESWIPVYRGADWHEREVWEMYGFQFDGHPDLRHIYLPAEFEGYPQRKDFPLLAREVKPWPGLVDKEPIPGEEEEADATAGGGES